jgi:hypothetical protein
MSEDFWASENWDSRATPTAAPGSERRVSGRGMVLAMLAFGTMTTATMWIYWTLHVGPFRPLQDAIAAAFPHSSPRVDGGQRKMHKGTPKILRIVMRVEFDPTKETNRGEAVVDAVEKIARQHVDLDAYEKLELYLFQGVPEQDVRQQEYSRELQQSATPPKPEKLSQSTKP